MHLEGIPRPVISLSRLLLSCSNILSLKGESKILQLNRLRLRALKEQGRLSVTLHQERQNATRIAEEHY